MTLDKETRASDFKIPSKYRRVVAKHTGNSFAEVAEIEESETPSPKDDEVRFDGKFSPDLLTGYHE